MANAVAEILLENLQQLLLYRSHLIENEKKHAEDLEKALRLCTSFLRRTSTARLKERPLELVRQMHDIVYKAEGIVDKFFSVAATAAENTTTTSSSSTRASRFSLPKSRTSKTTKLDSEQQGTHELFSIPNKDITDSVKRIYDEWVKLDLDALSLNPADEQIEEKLEPPPVRRELMVGFKDEAKDIIGYLREDSDKLDVISVTGKSGSGKTLLARKIFDDIEIQNIFPVRIWIHVSREFNKKDVYEHILYCLGETMEGRSDDELAKTIRDKLGLKKFLIVLDDVWTSEDRDKILMALPKSNEDGKVLLTSRNGNVACSPNKLKNLRDLTKEESWSLLQSVVFGDHNCPSELEVIGQMIAEGCKGLPLAIVVIGGILANAFHKSNGMNAKIAEWGNVMNIVIPCNETEMLKNIIALSYDKLPHHLSACFLYLGMFPQDFEIPVWKLIRMWIAEGFIQPKEDITREETAEQYLDQLISWNLVRVDKRRRDGGVKTIRIYDDIHRFCKSKAGNFLQEIGSIVEEFKQEIRCICIHSGVLKSVPPHIRSVAWFAEKGTTEITLAIAILTSLKLLRVMDVKPVIFTDIPDDMYKLVHLRYITLSFNATILPEAFAKLWNIQTLIVDTQYPTLEIKADIWKLSQLRHLKTNASAILPKEESSSSREGEKLQTLGTISPQSCRDEIFDRARNLKKLGIRGKLLLLFQGKTASFDCLGRLSTLEKLKLLNDGSSNPALDKLQSLPSPYLFPPKLRSLTLSKTFLKWEHMSTLAMLDRLEVLKLKEKAFMGKSWQLEDEAFHHLKILHIGHTDLVEWKAPRNHFPRLMRLELHNCKELKEIPIGLAEVPVFQLLDLYQSNLAAASAKNIYQAKKMKCEDSNFNLFIIPLEE